MAQTKIVATLGPASETPSVIRALIEAGADVFRINFSHGELESHRAVARLVRRVAGEMGREVALLGDVAGPKLRCGLISPEPIQLTAGRQVTLTSEKVAGTESLVPIHYDHFHEDVRVGQEIALDDGRIRLRAEAIEGVRVTCRVIEGGALSSHKGVNLPETELQIAAVTDDDRRAIALAVEENFDFLGLSFVGSAGDVELARSAVRERGGNLALIAKIERRTAIERLGEILDAADGAMVARGDLGVELPIERVPLVQKQVIRACNERAKPVITATQMLESMIHSHRPTRAEVTDIANAIFDGTDAVMLSGESAVGDFPVEAVRTMDRVAEVSDEAIDREGRLHAAADGHPLSDDAAMGQAASELAHDLRLDAIVCVTEGGTTARRIARHRPKCPILAVTSNLATCRRLLLSWGVAPILLPELANPPAGEAPSDIAGSSTSWGMEIWIGRILDRCVGLGQLQRGQRIAVVAGFPLHQPGTTNLIHLTTVKG